MSREEAIELLDNLVGTVSDNQDSDYDTALKMAIKALSQEPCDTYTEGYFKGYDDGLEQKLEEPCDYAISRDAFITRYREWMKSEYGKIPDDDTLAIRVIKSLPSVTHKSAKDYLDMADRKAKKIKDALTVTQKSGKWIYVREDKYRCSKCGTTTRVDEGGIDEKPMYRFCPYCGARMVEPQESEG